MYSEGFPGDDLATQNEVVQLSETAAALELLFQYMYRQRQPDLSCVPFETLAQLAEAAEKYQVFSAIEVCKMYMKASIPLHPVEVLAYAGRHDYATLCDEAAPLTINASVEDMSKHLGPATFIIWVLYREPWLRLFLRKNWEDHEIPSPLLHKGAATSCHLWPDFHSAVLNKLRCMEDFGIGSIFSSQVHCLDGCVQCRKRASVWEGLVTAAYKEILTFSSVRQGM